jgi:hypothetical protein
VYTFNVVPSGDGLVTIDVPNNKAQDLAGNDNTGATQLARVYDSTAPTLSEVTAVTDPSNDTTPSYTFSTTET